MKKYLGLLLIAIMAVSVVSAAGVVTTQKADAAKPALAKPHLISPKNHLIASQGSTINFEWTLVSGGYYYGLVIQKLRTDGTWGLYTGISTTGTGASWTFGDTGTFRWHVTARNSDNTLLSKPTTWRIITIE